MVPAEEGSRQMPLLLHFLACLHLRKKVSRIKYNTLYIQPAVQLLGAWFSFYPFPSHLCKIRYTALDPHLLPSFWCPHMVNTRINDRNWYLVTDVVSLFLWFTIYKLANVINIDFFFFQIPHSINIYN